MSRITTDGGKAKEGTAALVLNVNSSVIPIRRKGELRFNITSRTTLAERWEAVSLALHHPKFEKNNFPREMASVFERSRFNTKTTETSAAMSAYMQGGALPNSTQGECETIIADGLSKPSLDKQSASA